MTHVTDDHEDFGSHLDGLDGLQGHGAGSGTGGGTHSAADAAGTEEVPAGYDVVETTGGLGELFDAEESDEPDELDPEEPAEELPTYHSGRVRIIGAEPAGDAIREVTGPVVDEHPELPHWNESPTGQVPAVLDRSNGEDQGLAPPTWREESSDWEAHEEIFEPNMLSDDRPAVGALDESETMDVERAPWHFENDDTLVIAPEPGLEPVRRPAEPAGPHCIPSQRPHPRPSPCPPW